MSTPQHTPGPWHVVPRSGPGRWITAEITFGDVGECIAEGVYEMADARLIAAAPDLLDELRHLADLLDVHFENGGSVVGIGTTNKAREIIARATGKES